MKQTRYLIFIGMGLELVGIMVACLYLGRQIDFYYNLQGIGLAFLSLSGLAGWLTHIVMLTRAIDKKDME